MRAPGIFKWVAQAHSEPSELLLCTARSSRSSVKSEEAGPVGYKVIAR